MPERGERLVEVETRGGVGLVRLARPEKRNAMTPRMLEELCEGAEAADRSSRAVLVCGAGSVFCAGFDLDLCAEDESVLGALLEGLSRAIVTLRGLAAPVVLAAHGAAIAGGCALLGGADVVVADAGAKLGYPVVRLGVSPAVSAPFLRGMVEGGPCRDRLLDPGLISGEEGARRGRVHGGVGGRGGGGPAAERIAADLAGKPGEGLRATKGWLAEIGAEGPEAAGLAAEGSVGLAGSAEQRGLLGAWRRG